MTMRNYAHVILVLFALLVLVVLEPGCSATGPAETTASKRGPKQAEKSGGGEFPPAPRALANTELKTLDGGKIKIADLQGKVVLINLWATWCAPCIEEMPYFNELQDRYRDDGFVVLGLNSDEETEAQVRKFVEDQKLNYKIGWADEAVTDEFMKISKLPGIPQSLLLNRNGEMTGMFRGGGKEVIDKMVESVEKLMEKKETKTD